MPMQRGAALLLLLAAFAGVVDGGIVCADDADFDGAAIILGGQSCQGVADMFLSPYAGLDALTAEQCNTTLVQGGGPGGSDVTLRDGLQYMLFCCGGQPTAEACGPLLPPEANPCASASDFEPLAPIGDGHCRGDEDITDQQACESSGYPEAWDPAAEEQCDVGRIDGELAVRQAACAAVGGTWAHTTCFEQMMALPNVTFTESACSVRHPELGNVSTTNLLNFVGPSCCGSPENMKDVCDTFRDVGLPNPCNNPADFTPSAPIDPNNPEGPDCSLYITLAFQDAYSPSSPPVLCNFTAAECARDLSPEFGSDPGDLTVEVFLGYMGQRCCSGGAPTLACTPMQGDMPCGGGNTSRPHNVTCHEIRMLYQERRCCGSDSGMCAEVKRHYREHACCGMPAKHVPAPWPMMP